MDVSGQLHAPAALPSGKNPGTHGKEAGWAPEPVWTFYYYYYYYYFKFILTY